ncbi:2-oxo acid dehydrogenase subunit E2 [Planosporangium thailandense]|uniref:Dihydrolipoamide acetyltransferase component of pyruvate dehydrogenase complex n=1 Tax=Planosporangium thailandense TaxID=765197 RepID=A0ABX0Y5G9_9ACTN|nr:dihydrolipoamide acetyltransferase family protein [Planosporangium thailandense]NJC72544.1 2-oxo acid dehydrogenase subunit E2 [Planosporangium thailandense]
MNASDLSGPHREACGPDRSEGPQGVAAPAGLGAGATGQVFRLPDLGEGLTEAEIVEWRVAVGDTVEVDQIVVEVETAKAVVDVPCPYSGRVAALHGEPGEQRPVGGPLVTIEPLVGRAESADHGEPVDRSAPLADRSTERAEPLLHAVYREEERAGVGSAAGSGGAPGSGEGSGNVLVGYGTGHAASGRRRRRRVGQPAAPASTPVLSPAPSPASTPAPSPASDRSRSPIAVRVISPLVRRLARDHGIDVAALRGTGPGGVIRRADVEGALAVASSGPSAALPGPSTAPQVTAAPRGPRDEVVIPLTGVRRAIAEKLSRSRREIPEVTIWVDVDATALLDTRAAINAAGPDQPVSVLALLARICVNALQRYPALNARVDTERGEIIQSGRINLGVAAQTDRGLIVPVIHDAQRLSTLDLAAALSETVTQARAGALPPARMTGGTFTLNNYGVFGVDGSTPIINHPEAALLGIGRIVDKPWVVDGQLAVRKVAEISLTFDHRVCDGGTAGGFLRHVADCIEQPALLIAHV